MLPQSVRDRYDITETRNAAAVLSSTNPDQFRDICEVLDAFALTSEDILAAGGNETDRRPAERGVQSRAAGKVAGVARAPLGLRHSRHSASRTFQDAFMRTRCPGETPRDGSDIPTARLCMASG